jgi:hypothetical protein
VWLNKGFNPALDLAIGMVNQQVPCGRHARDLSDACSWSVHNALTAGAKELAVAAMLS